ncbi:tigger transposable element-derived protein 4 [Nephila pilipes]|uniref:Tigger transposable element-derived protein 4 n=1 Tax=Nephila pilipes TaxID=299642 RepID=A0A8X6NPV1_NEPPI|nr:tigger transposable element-derived protein 4 [Nephila pilipes]
MEVDKGVKKKDIALKFDITPNSLSTIIKNRDKLQNYDSSNSCSKRLRTCVYEDVDEAVLKRIHTIRDKNVPICGPFVIEKPLLFAKTLGYHQFLGSYGWLEKFKKRHGIAAKESISEISKAWNYDVADRTIHNSFAKARFFVCSESSEDDGDIPSEEMKKNIDTAKGKTRNYGFCAA